MLSLWLFARSRSGALRERVRTWLLSSQDSFSHIVSKQGKGDDKIPWYSRNKMALLILIHTVYSTNHKDSNNVILYYKSSRTTEYIHHRFLMRECAVAFQNQHISSTITSNQILTIPLCISWIFKAPR